MCSTATKIRTLKHVVAKPQTYCKKLMFNAKKYYRSCLLVWVLQFTISNSSAQEFSAPISLTPDIVPFGDVNNFFQPDQPQFSPDGRVVYFRGSLDDADFTELYKVPTAGGANPNKLNLPVINDVTFSLLSPNGQYLIYVEDGGAGATDHLYSVRLSDGHVQMLTDGWQFAMNLGISARPSISPDGLRVVFVARDLETPFSDRLYGVPIDGSEAVAALQQNGQRVISYQISPDSSRVVYEGFFSPVERLYSVPIRGGADLTLSNSAGGLTSPRIDRYRFIDNGNSVLHSRSETVGVTLNTYIESVPFDGGDARQITQSNGDQGLTAIEFEYDHATQNLITQLRVDIDSNELYAFSAMEEDAPRVKLHDDLAAGREVTHYKLPASSNGLVVYRADADLNDVFELYVVDLNSGQNTKLNNAPVSGGDVSDNFKVSEDGSYVVYLADEETNNRFELFAAPTNGGGSVKLNKALADNDPEVSQFDISSDNRFVVFIADHDEPGVNELYAAAIDGSRVVKLNSDLPFSGGVTQFEISPNSDSIVFRADQEVFGDFQLYSIQVIRNDDDDTCFVIKAENDNVVTFCL